MMQVNHSGVYPAHLRFQARPNNPTTPMPVDELNEEADLTFEDAQGHVVDWPELLEELQKIQGRSGVTLAQIAETFGLLAPSPRDAESVKGVRYHVLANLLSALAEVGLVSVMQSTVYQTSQKSWDPPQVSLLYMTAH